MSNNAKALRTWRVGDQVLSLGQFPLIMGIVNATPDSFSDGGEYLDPQRAIEHAMTLVHQGADIIDVGGESTRPGSQPVPAPEQLRRVIPVIAGLAEQSDVLISIDTTSAEVARETLAAGARIVNDISGLTFDEQMVPLVAASDCGVICMHIQGTPQTMQDAPCYDNVVVEICEFLEGRLIAMEAAGVDPQRVVFDPGIGFGKTAAHNLEILSGIERLRSQGGRCWSDTPASGSSRRSSAGSWKSGRGERSACRSRWRRSTWTSCGCMTCRPFGMLWLPGTR